MFKNLLIGLFLSIASGSVFADRTIPLQYDFFFIQYNCDKKGFDYFEYDTVKDTGNLPRLEPFHQEERLPKDCRQKSTGTYKKPKLIASKEYIDVAMQKIKDDGFVKAFKDSMKNAQPLTVESNQQFDRGHGNHQNIWDHNAKYMYETNSMANVVPQDSELNRKGLWRHLEKVTECFRDDHSVHVIGGNFWGTNTVNDYFMESHGVVTPDYLWKVLLIDGTKIYAYFMPNDSTPTAYNGNNYITTVSWLEKQLGYKINVPESLKSVKATSTPKYPKSCSFK